MFKNVHARDRLLYRPYLPFMGAEPAPASMETTMSGVGVDDLVGGP
jgi:hypothetical protein